MCGGRLWFWLDTLERWPQLSRAPQPAHGEVHHLSWPTHGGISLGSSGNNGTVECGRSSPFALGMAKCFRRVASENALLHSYAGRLIHQETIIKHILLPSSVIIMKCRWKQQVFRHASLDVWKQLRRKRETLWDIERAPLDHSSPDSRYWKEIRGTEFHGIVAYRGTVWQPGRSWDILKSRCTTSFGQRRRDEQNLGSGRWRGSLCWRLRVLFTQASSHRLQIAL